MKKSFEVGAPLLIKENKLETLLFTEDYQTQVLHWVDKLCEQFSFELVECDFFQAGQKPILRVFIHKEGGVNVEDCTLLSRELGNVLDLEDVLPFAYQLEVSSPGLDRPFKTIKDWQRNLNRLVKITLNEPKEEKLIWIAELLEVMPESNSVRVSVQIKKDDVEWVISLDEVLNAKVEIQF
jgi:ribosome maturation factor RimP